MKLIVGLGNPGPKYETTRHNVGFLAVDRLLDSWKAGGLAIKNQAEVFSATVGTEKVLLVKPQTFMNLSGKSVAPLFTFYKCKPEDLIVIHDELDLDSMSMRVKVGGGTGGHNGLKSIDECLGSEQNGYYRVRLGIGHPRPLGLKLSPADYVLQPFGDSELEKLDLFLDQVEKAVALIVAGRGLAAMTEFNRKEQ
jgi:PTH1 family peptidyl-tRNA hydrolase